MVNIFILLRGPLWCLESRVDGIPIDRLPENTSGILKNVNKTIKIMVDSNTVLWYNIPILNENEWI